jgi:hypothetical protein
MTNLQHAFHVPSIYPPWVKGQISLDRWNTPCLHYIDPTPPYLIPEHCRDLLYPETGTLHIIIASAPNDPTVAVHHSSPTTQGTARGLTQTQALCQAVNEALTNALPHHSHNIVLWICHKSIVDKLTTLSPHSDTPMTLTVHRLLYNYLTTHSSATMELHLCKRAWLRSRLRTEIKRIATMEEPLEIPEAEMDPKAAM